MIDAAVSSLRNILTELAAGEPVDVLVPNLPNVSITPAIQSRDGAAVQEATELTTRFNRQLEQVLTQTRGIRLHRLDVAQLADRVREDPSALGFASIASPCNQLSACEGYLFWDNVHPTTRAHEQLAGAAFRTIASP
jgi:outer membrane lipase/esterase